MSIIPSSGLVADGDPREVGEAGAVGGEVAAGVADGAVQVGEGPPPPSALIVIVNHMKSLLCL